MTYEEIMRAVQYHHILVESAGYYVVMTSLVGSQNYNLDTEKSDIDTYSFILPSLVDLAQAEAPKAGIIFAEDGHCNFKDIRVAINLLKKASPNSVEYFTSKYKVCNPMFENLFQEYLDDNFKLWHMVHCNYEHMLDAITGMAHQLTKRNMPAGKRFSHAIRLEDMIYHFFNSKNALAILDLCTENRRDLALSAKLDINTANDEVYERECLKIADKLDIYKNNFKATDKTKQIEQLGKELIDNFQLELIQKYLTETNK